MARPDPSASVRVLYRDEHLLVLDKPSGLPTTSPGRERTLVQVAHELDPDAPRLHPSSRLDAEVSGVVTFARTARATEHLMRARSEHRYQRGYLGVAAPAAGGALPDAGEWTAAIGLDPRDARKRRACADSDPGARPASSRFSVLERLGPCALLWLQPQTGRTHQLRVHAAHAGAPLCGDRPYGGPLRVVLADGSAVMARRTMLHCCRVCVPAVERSATLCFEAPLPADLLAFARALGADAVVLPPPPVDARKRQA